VHPEQLAEYYPRLFHMAWNDSWPSIEKNGLLSTKALLDHYQINDVSKKKLIKEHRPHWVEIKAANLPTAVVRDQKPMSDAGVRRALAGEEPSEWYDLLNSMVFFWPTKGRLKTMMSAQAYKGMRHDLIVVDTQRLVETYLSDIRISSMNSGATKPKAHPRDLNLFKCIADFPLDKRLKSHGPAKAIAEVCVIDRVGNISDMIIDVMNVTVEDLPRI
jgi:hypothetical protein